MKIILISILLILVLGFAIWCQYKELKFRDEYNKLLDEVITFSYFVGNCNITPENKETIINRLKEFRKKNALYSSKRYTDLLNEITLLYYRRFLKKD